MSRDLAIGIAAAAEDSLADEGAGRGMEGGNLPLGARMLELEPSLSTSTGLSAYLHSTQISPTGVSILLNSYEAKPAVSAGLSGSLTTLSLAVMLSLQEVDLLVTWHTEKAGSSLTKQKSDRRKITALL